MYVYIYICRYKLGPLESAPQNRLGLSCSVGVDVRERELSCCQQGHEGWQKLVSSATSTKNPQVPCCIIVYMCICIYIYIHMGLQALCMIALGFYVPAIKLRGSFGKPNQKAFSKEVLGNSVMLEKRLWC